MANDVYTTFRYDYKKPNYFFERYLKDVGDDMEKVLKRLNAKIEYDEHGYITNMGDLVDSKWCEVFENSGETIQFHSAWCQPTHLLCAMTAMFGIDGLVIQFEDVDYPCLGRVFEKDGFFYGQGYSGEQFDEMMKRLSSMTTDPEWKKRYEENTYQEDYWVDRYCFISEVEPTKFKYLDDALYQTGNKVWNGDDDGPNILDTYFTETVDTRKWRVFGELLTV